MTKAQAIKALPRLVKKVNAALQLLGHPAKVSVIASSDKSDPLSCKIILGMRADLDADWRDMP